MMPNPSRQPFAVPCLPTLAAVVLAAACTAPNPDFRPLGLVVADTTTKQSADLVFDVQIDVQEAPVTVEYEAVDDTAVKGREYLETKGTLTLEPGTTTTSIVVPTLLYNHIPGDVNLKLNVTATRRTVIDVQTGTGTITPMAELARFTSIVSGGDHSCGVTPKGTVKCWGVNDGGQLGNNSTRYALEPVDVVGVTNAVTVSAEGQHTCVVTSLGTVKCWGRNFGGQLGNKSTNDSLVPVDVPNLSGVTAVAAGNGHTCALTTEGEVKCWGSNYFGELGNNSTVTESLVPVTVVGLTGVTALVAREQRTCAVAVQGKVMCWGNLGINSPIISKVPVDVKIIDGVTSLTGVTAIAVGSRHACAVTAQGKVMCWGANETGQLGNNSTAESLVANEVLGGFNATAVSTGAGHTCAVTTQGTVKCWGIGGSLGNNSTSTALAPVDVVGLTGVTAVAAGNQFTLALTEQGTVKGWGDGRSLGGNSVTNVAVPVDVALATGVTAIASGGSHACALTKQETVKCWGSNRSGQLGNNSTITESLAAVDVVDLTGVTAIGAGIAHACALTTQGTVKCWGSNLFYQLGNNSTTNSPTPVDVVGLSDVISIAAGAADTCAVTGQGNVKCWGTTYSPMPVDVKNADLTSLTGIRSIAVGNGHTCALTEQGNVKCWGQNSYGELGNNTTTQSMVAVDVGRLANVTSIAAGSGYTCALTAKGTVRCWGLNDASQLGNNSTANSWEHVEVIGLTGVTSISAGNSHTCGTTAQGTAGCWGSNANGEFGSQSTENFVAEAMRGQKVLAISAGFDLTAFITPHHTVRQTGLLSGSSLVPIDTVYVLKD